MILEISFIYKNIEKRRKFYGLEKIKPLVSFGHIYATATKNNTDTKKKVYKKDIQTPHNPSFQYNNYLHINSNI